MLRFCHLAGQSPSQGLWPIEDGRALIRGGIPGHCRILWNADPGWIYSSANGDEETRIHWVEKKNSLTFEMVLHEVYQLRRLSTGHVVMICASHLLISLEKIATSNCLRRIGVTSWLELPQVPYFPASPKPAFNMFPIGFPPSDTFCKATILLCQVFWRKLEF